MIVLFASDENIRQMQRASARIPKGMTLSPEQQRIESIEADREMREHRRLREFAWLLFIAPIWASILIWLVQFLATIWFARSEGGGS